MPDTLEGRVFDQPVHFVIDFTVEDGQPDYAVHPAGARLSNLLDAARADLRACSEY